MQTKTQKGKAIRLHFYRELLGKGRLELLWNYPPHLKLEYPLAITSVTVTGLALL